MGNGMFFTIPTKTLVATRMAGAHFTKLMGGGAFPGLQILVVSDRWQSSVQHERDYTTWKRLAKQEELNFDARTSVIHTPTIVR
jgi:hypothetical protein